MAANHRSSNTTFDDDAIIIKQYKPLIDKLIPLQHENRLLEGLNKFSAKLPSKVRNVIKEEVIRLTSLTDASADNSEFAKFPVMKFKHFGIDMSLDKLGQEILQRETSRYDDRYTVGVFESVMNSAHYQSHIKQEQQKKIAQAFKVESQSFQDIDFGEDLAIRPNFTVSCPEFEKGKHCRLASLSFNGMLVETKRPPTTETEDTSKMLFTLPQVSGLSESNIDIAFKLIGSSFNKATGVFETRFIFAESVSDKLKQQWAKYIENSINQFPLERELEIERVLQNLERDRILSNCPWIPLFLGMNNEQLVPKFQLSTPKNKDYNSQFVPSRDLPSEQVFQNLIKELTKFEETFLLIGCIERKDKDIHVAVTHRQLAAANLLKQFVELAAGSEKFRVIQFRLKPIPQAHKRAAFDSHGIIGHDNPELSELSHILFCKDVSDWVGNLEVSKPEPFKPFPRAIVNESTQWPIDLALQQEQDQRADIRYQMSMDAQIKTGMFSQADAKLNDISISGLRLTLVNSANVVIEKEIKISIKELKLKNTRYEVVQYNKTTGLLRVKLPKDIAKVEKQRLQAIFDANRQFFAPRDTSRTQRQAYNYLWELSTRNLPCASILITNNRFTIDRLKTVYHDQQAYDLKPFGVVGNEVPLHGFFADKDSKGPKSSLLDNMLRNRQQDAHVVHVERTKDRRIIYVKESEFLYGQVRNQISQHVTKKAVDACVSHISAMRCHDQDVPLNKKRLAQISKIDLDIYKQLQLMQKGYTHVLYITNVSTFHNALLQFGIHPKADHIATEDSSAEASP